ncbi:MAG: S1-like domain-containing RNA-binding protein [Myxococcota bacterium]
MEIGRSQRLEVMERVPDGFWLADGEGSAFLPHGVAPEGLSVGQRLKVFVYTDRNGDLLATTDPPKVERDGFACLEVVDVAGHGAYLDWGLDRDLFVPHNLQHRPLKIGEHAVVVVDVDEHGRIFGSTKLGARFESAMHALRIGQKVSLLVYGFNDVGAQVIVDGRFTGLVYDNEMFREVMLGDAMDGWITGLRSDGRADVSLQPSRKAGTLDAREVIWDRLVENDGFLGLTDRSAPEEIERVLQMSKKRFKKAVGSLYKDRRIRIAQDGLYVVEE